MTRMLRPGHDRNRLSPVLGLMFRNTADARVVSEGLQVSLKDLRQAHLAPQALRPNPSGVFVLHQQRHLRAAQTNSPLTTQDFALTVFDPLGRYLPLTISAELLGEALAEASATSSSPEAGPPQLPLYSAAARPVPAGQAQVRVDLRLASHPDTPAAWARLELWHDDNGSLLAEGLADARGSALLLCPLPALRDPPLSSSPPVAPAPLSQWNVSLRAFWNPAIARLSMPELGALRSLPEVPLLQDRAPPRPLAPVLLTAGSPLVIRSDGSSCVFVGA
jgi:hypothetical protein